MVPAKSTKAKDREAVNVDPEAPKPKDQGSEDCWRRASIGR